MSADRLLEIREQLTDLVLHHSEDEDQISELRAEEEELLLILGPCGASLVGYPADYPHVLT